METIEARIITKVMLLLPSILATDKEVSDIYPEPQENDSIKTRKAFENDTKSTQDPNSGR